MMYHWKWVLFLFFVSGLCLVRGQDEDEVESGSFDYEKAAVKVRFETKNKTYVVREGHNFTLNCTIRNAGSFALMWRKAPNVLLMIGNMDQSHDPRLVLDLKEKGSTVHYNINIADTKKKDASRYDCMVMLRPPISISHIVKVCGKNEDCPNLTDSATSRQLSVSCLVFTIAATILQIWWRC